MKQTLIDTVTFEFGEAEVFPGYIIMVMNEGVHIVPEYNDELKKLSDTYYQEEPFVYITNRVNSYSVDPRIYLETSKIPNLIGFAIVSEKEIQISTAQVEQIFLNKPMRVFDTLPQAISWTKQLLEED